MTLMISNTSTAGSGDDDDFTPPAFPPEHYGCPPWCTVNIRTAGRNYINHDSADGMPDWPNFHGYRHWTGRYVEYANAGDSGPLSIHLDLNPGDSAPHIAVSNPMDDWSKFTLEEAGQLAATIRQQVEAWNAACPPWCDSHGCPSAWLDGHYAERGVFYASAAPGELGQALPYGVDLVQYAPEIHLYGASHHEHHEVITLNLREAEAVADAITGLVTAARGASAAL